MTPFSIFAIFYVTTILLEMVEKWEHPVFTGVFFILSAALVLTKITRLKFLFFLALTSVYFVYFRFPEVPNHVNLIILLNVFLIFGLVYSLINRSRFPGDDDYFDMMLPFLRVTLIPIYFIAGFHKLNSDFFNFEVSCAAGILHNLKNMLLSNFLGIPSLFFIAVGFGFVVWKLYDLGLLAFIKSRLPKIRLPLGIGLILLIVSALPVAAGYVSTADIKYLIILTTMAFVLALELIGGLLLIIPKLQALVLPAAWAMHSVLAMIGFVDFSSVAFAFLLTFIPNNYCEILNADAGVRVLNYRIHRARVYFILNAIGGVFTAVYFLFYPEFNINFITGFLLNAGAIIFIFPILSALFSDKRPLWQGVPVFGSGNSGFVYLFLALLILHGMTPYFGLRTAGNYSMYSNLKTEGESSNHLLLGNNPLEIWNYQDDLVYFIEIDDRSAEIGHKYRPLKENQLPVVEFKKLIYKWKEDCRRVPLEFEYGGRVYRTADVINDPRWGVEKRDWEMFLMDFRIIQPEGPNRCRW